MSDDLFVERKDGIVTVTINRPKALNALTFGMYEGLATLCREIDSDTTTKVLVVTGAGPDAFAAGTDIGQFRTFKTDADALDYEALVERVLSALEQCRVPTIAAMAGVCAAGGAAIASSCDLRIAASNLRFGVPIARTLGNCLSQDNLARFVRLIGVARVKEMIFTARLYSAEEALACGIVSAIVEPDSLAIEAEALARRVMSHAPLTISATKEGLARLRHPVEPADGLLLRCYKSRDFREGVAAFGEKRSPGWEGR